MADLLWAAFSALFAAGMIAFVLAPYGLLFLSPKSDITRLKRDIEGASARVVGVTRKGFELGGRYGPHFRTYEVVTDDTLKGRQTLRVGVSTALFTDPEVKVYRPSRIGLFG